MARRLDTDDLGSVLEAAWDARPQWKNVGLALKVPQPTLAAIEADNAKAGDRLREMLTCWLRGADPQVTWGALAKALRSATVDCGDAAQAIEDKHVRSQHPTAEAPVVALSKLDQTPRLYELRRLDGVKVAERIASQWEEVALSLHFEHPVLKQIQRDHTGDVAGACLDMLGRWLQEVEGTLQPTWRNLVLALAEAGFGVLAEELQRTLAS